MLNGFFGREAGRVFSKQNAKAIKMAAAHLRAALRAAGIDPDDEDGDAESASDAGDGKPASPTKTKEAALASLAFAEAGGFSMSDLATLLSAALNADVKADENGYIAERRRIADIYDDRVIYQINWNGPFYAASYTVAEDGVVTFGTPSLVVRKVDYISPGGANETSVSEAGEFISEAEIVPLNEAAVADNGRARIKLIAPGWGSSGYYPPDVLRRDGPKVFRAGTKMFWNHPTAQEEAHRPEGDLNNLAAVLTEDARFEQNGSAGPGLYAEAEVRTSYREAINDLAPYIGTSIRALGRAKIADAEGKRGPVVEAITAAKSVDFVTTPGAGGRVLALFEAARGAPAGLVDISEAGTMPADTGATEMPFTKDDEDKIAKLVEAAVTAAVAPLAAQNAALRDANDLREARTLVDNQLSTYREMPKTLRQRIAPEIAAGFERDANGRIDAGKLREAVSARVASEYRMLAEAGAPGFAKLVEGFGDSRPSGDAGNGGGNGGQPSGGNDLEDELRETFAGWGMGEDAAKIAARGRAGR